MNVLDLLAISLRRSPGKAAIRFPGADDLSYAELFSRARALAAGFAARGIGKGDRIAFFAGNRPELVTAYLAALSLGAVLVPVNLAYRRREIAHMLGDAAPRLLFTERDQIPVLDELADEDRASVEAVVLAEELEGWKGDAFSPPLVDGSDLAMLLYTSGTTGKSKGARITHDNLLATMTGLLAAWAWEADDALLLTLPLFHTHGLVVGLFCALAAGATVHLRRRFDAAETVEDLLSGEPTLFFGVPTLYTRLVEELRRRRDAGEIPDLAHLRLFCSGSAPLSPETFEAFRDLTGHDILERYGMTETGMNLSNPYAGPRRPGTVGTPLPGVSIRIVDLEDRDVPPGETGELLVRGGNVFEGYWQAPEKTAASFLQGGWFRTGDLARRDPETGSVTLLGRRHELIISGGFNIYPREVEEVLATLPGVREAAVVGRAHPDWGEVPVAFLVVEKPLDPAGIVAACKGQMAGFKVPREIRFVDSLPRYALGKVQKHLLPA
ncbi:MAG TPA: AMP-binding protein [Thermoanaerobaculia bacterium]|nr:AMP-binding protein [Thermoanaerobaculia bacterium]